MKVIILAAGQGSRLGPLTKTKPKCLMELNGKSILEYQLELFNRKKISDVIIITGYKQEKITENGVIKLYNSNYKESNMVASLFCEEKYFDDDLIISYGDIIYSRSVFEKLLDSNNTVSVIVDLSWEKLWNMRMNNIINDIESMKIENNKIVDLGKKVDDLSHVDGQYIGLIKIKRTFLNEFTAFYHSLNRSREYAGNSFDNMYMTTLIQLIIDHYNNVTPVFINGGWLEIDTVSDLSIYENSNYIKKVIKN